jgi:hypothetical protein
LRIVIGVFEQLRTQQRVIACRSSIEDGQFVGWLSYPDVPVAQDAFLMLQSAFKSQGLGVKLRTRDEQVPLDGNTTVQQPVMSYAS